MLLVFLTGIFPVHNPLFELVRVRWVSKCQDFLNIKKVIKCVDCRVKSTLAECGAKSNTVILLHTTVQWVRVRGIKTINKCHSSQILNPTTSRKTSFAVPTSPTPKKYTSVFRVIWILELQTCIQLSLPGPLL